MNGALTRDDILQLFGELAAKLRNRHVRGHVYIVGGAAMIFGFNRERTTHDVDGRIRNDKDAVLAAIAEVAKEHPDLPDNWLNENATLFMPHAEDPRPLLVFDTPDLVVTGASAEHLLAMKLAAARDTDVDDIRALIDNLNIRWETQAINIHDAIFPHTPLADEGLKILHKTMAAKRRTAAEEPRAPAPAESAARAADRSADHQGPQGPSR